MSDDYFKTCPRCLICAVGFVSIDRVFGHRAQCASIKPQSWCKKCRNRKEIMMSDINSQIAADATLANQRVMGVKACTKCGALESQGAQFSPRGGDKLHPWCNWCKRIDGKRRRENAKNNKAVSVEPDHSCDSPNCG